MAGFKDHFSDIATGYRQARPGYPEMLIDRLVELAPALEAAWDVGCGSGQLSRGLAGRFGRVVATDASAEQIAAAEPDPRIDYRVARAEESGLPEATFDLIVAAQAAHWFALDRFYAEARRVGRPGAAIVLVGYGRPQIAGAVGSWLDTFHDRSLGDDWPPERWLLVNGYRDLPFPFDEVSVTPLETRLDWTLSQLAAYIETWSALRAVERAGRRSVVDAALAELAAAWGDPERTRTVRWPIRLRAGHLPTRGVGSADRT